MEELVVRELAAHNKPNIQVGYCYIHGNTNLVNFVGKSLKNVFLLSQNLYTQGSFSSLGFKMAARNLVSEVNLVPHGKSLINRDSHRTTKASVYILSPEVSSHVYR